MTSSSSSGSSSSGGSVPSTTRVLVVGDTSEFHVLCEALEDNRPLSSNNSVSVYFSEASRPKQVAHFLDVFGRNHSISRLSLFVHHSFPLTTTDAHALGQLVARSSAVTDLSTHVDSTNVEALLLLWQGIAQSTRLERLTMILVHPRHGGLGVPLNQFLAQGNSSLQVLNLADCTIQEKDAVVLANVLESGNVGCGPALKALTLINQDQWLEQQALVHILSCLGSEPPTSLETLAISGNVEIQQGECAEVFLDMIKHNPHLQVLQLECDMPDSVLLDMVETMERSNVALQSVHFVGNGSEFQTLQQQKLEYLAQRNRSGRRRRRFLKERGMAAEHKTMTGPSSSKRRLFRRKDHVPHHHVTTSTENGIKTKVAYSLVR